ncbi:histidine phosphotransferase family protein [Yoonia sediminilitoris]|uniref:Histidine phosphotransferase ChpT n=1 Tax=Yoonia sediminilitoris TaxID=1286148 RepID=A0A2T6KCM8_9RHOB|nr:histidine phosphotransferase family protein [Yoonia sediminilitoris]PUB12706.1 histidine phosphotransferase ChpT [Yoonia sediminilitoris]RCW94185.1 histidine phosphotransferase ChpT [Yoonia sediminilitoris]
MTTDIAALVGSRICHDLISPIGAIGNGVELLALTDGHAGAEMSLISESVQNANARIRFFRIAFGASGADQLVGRTETLSILSDMASGGRMTYHWMITDDQPRRDVRCAFLLLLSLESAMPLGGEVRIEMNGNAWALTAAGRRIMIDDDLWASLQSPDSGYVHTAAQVQFALLPSCLAEAGRVLHPHLSEEQLIMRF